MDRHEKHAKSEIITSGGGRTNFETNANIICVEAYKNVIDHIWKCRVLMTLLVCCRFVFFGFFDWCCEYQAYMLDRVFWLHQLNILCDQQELACTPTGQPHRVDMKEMSCRNMYGQIDWGIFKTVSKPTLCTHFHLAEKIGIITMGNIVSGKCCAPPPLR